MRLSSPFERIQGLVGLIDRRPSIKQVVRLLSTELDPTGEISGVSWMHLNDEGIFDYVMVSGLRVNLDPTVQVALSDDNAVAHSLRVQRSLYFDMASMFVQYRQATHRKELIEYPTGIVLPITDRVVIACALNTPVEKLREFEGYFECIRLVIALWQSKLFFQRQKIANTPAPHNVKLAARQEYIFEQIKAGKTNRSIARELGFSESLIRQETIIIYEKLGISGRKQIIE